ncbi:MAG TPA: SDR family oxidoreductase [Myxococcota bacterium]|nr:SDR family oxidoreductase [Myxococcota bacterium]
MKAALVTGAGKRIGKAIGERLLLEGFQVILHANSSISELEIFAASNERKSRIIAVVGADLSTKEGQDSLVSFVKAKIDVLDLLVHNASAFAPKNFGEISRGEFSDMLAVNLEAPFFITQGLLDLLYRSFSPSVVNILDAMWERPCPQFSHYAVSKAGLAILTKALGNELSPKIRVNAVAPGAILFQPFHTQEVRERTLERIPVKSLGRPSDIAEAVMFLSEKAIYATGEILVIDGGRSIAP